MHQSWPDGLIISRQLQPLEALLECFETAFEAAVLWLSLISKMTVMYCLSYLSADERLVHCMTAALVLQQAHCEASFLAASL